MQFRIGQRVRVISTMLCSGRISVVAEKTKNSLGETIYILADGGWLYACELQPA